MKFDKKLSITDIGVEVTMKIKFEERFFFNQGEWHYFLFQLNIPEEKYNAIDEVELEVSDFTATDSDGNELTI